MALIQILPSALSDQIAAGEVVERPSSVAKELLENALDAGATRVTVDFELGGVQRLRIVDNGVGMTAEDAVLSVRRHATSKISKLDDLNHIGTLGFRGEALASIASVSKFRVRTKQEGQLAATLVTVDGGAEPVVSEIGGPVGTEVVVEDLFFNVPARRKFLKRKETESTHIVETTQRLALCYPKVAFKAVRDGKVVLDLPIHNDLTERLQGLFPKSTTSGLKSFSVPGAFGLSGVIGSPSEARGSTRHYYLFVNGRIVKDRVMMSAIQSGCGHLLSKGKHPFAVLSLNLPSQAVDVNVHPAKTEVRFADSRQIFRLIARTVESVLMRKSSVLDDLAASQSSGQVSGLQIKRMVEQNTSAMSNVNPAQPTVAPPSSGLVSQKRRVFDAMARLAQKQHAQGADPMVTESRQAKTPTAQFEISAGTSTKEQTQPALFESVEARSQDAPSEFFRSSDRVAPSRVPDESGPPAVADPAMSVESGVRRLDLPAQDVSMRSEASRLSNLLHATPVFMGHGLVAFSELNGITLLDVGLLNQRNYLERRRAGRYSMVDLEQPILMDSGRAERTQNLLVQLKAVGLTAEPFGATTVRVTAVDASLKLAVDGKRLDTLLREARSTSELELSIQKVAGSVEVERWRTVLELVDSEPLLDIVTQVLRSQVDR